MSLSHSFHRALVTLTRPANYGYFIKRNQRGALPVYSDWKLNRTKYIVEIKNIEGDATVSLLALQCSLLA